MSIFDDEKNLEYYSHKQMEETDQENFLKNQYNNDFDYNDDNLEIYYNYKILKPNNNYSNNNPSYNCQNENINKNETNDNTYNIKNDTNKNLNNNQNEENNDIKIIEVGVYKSKKKRKEEKDKKPTNQGRKKKEEAMNCNTKRNKYAKDNIFRKIKSNFFNKFLVNYINENIKCVYNKQKYLVRKFNKTLVTDVSIQFNIDLFNSKIRNLLNQEISDKYSTIELNENKMILKELEKNPQFNEFLDNSVNDIYFNLFLNDNYKEIISNDFKIDKEEIDFENITGIIEELREQGENDEYLDRFNYYAHNINELMDESKKRSQRKPKININPNDN